MAIRVTALGSKLALTYEHLSASEKARWDAAADVARAAVMRSVADGFETLLRLNQGDPEAAVCEPGIRLVIESLRKVTG